MPSDDAEPTHDPRPPQTEATSGESNIGVVGLLLGLAAPFTCGITALLGYYCCVRGIRRKARPRISWAGLVVCCVLGFHGCPLYPVPGFLPDFVQRWYADPSLRALGLPELPPSARNIRYHRVIRVDCFWGLYARFQATPDDIDAYFAELGLTPDLRIGHGEGEVRLRGPDEWRESDYFLPVAEKPRNPAVFPGPRWWRPHHIRRGRAYHAQSYNKDGGPAGIGIYHDEDTNALFLFHHFERGPLRFAPRDRRPPMPSRETIPRPSTDGGQ